MNLKRVDLDTSKAVFTLHGVDQDKKAVLRRNARRAELEVFSAKLPPTPVVLEACGGSHHWGRRLASFGHTVQLIPPQYVKPFVRRAKNDRNDAEAISEAASWPNMPSVPVKSAEQQTEALVLSACELLVRQRTQLVNAVRGHVAELSIVAAKRANRLPGLLETIAAEEAVPEAAKEMLAFLGAQVVQLDERIAELERRMKQQHKANTIRWALAEVPGIGPISALSLALTIEPGRFASERHFAAWLGLTPKERSTGGRPRMGGISRAGNERLRQLLVVGTMAFIRFAKPGSKTASPWLLALLERKPRKLTAVALANKMARIVWARLVKVPANRLRLVGIPGEGMMTTGEAYWDSTKAATQAAGVAAVT